MGISGLLPLLKEIQVSGHISEFKGKRLAVDAYVWLHKGAFGCAADLVKGIPTTKFVDYAMYRVRMLKYHGITPYIVFDGGPLPAKKGTEVSRAASRKANLEKALALEAQGRHADARDAYTKCVDITPEIAYQFIKALKAENIDYVVAPYEADAQLCFLEREGLVDGIITEDSDLLVFGCKQVIFKLDKDGKCVWIQREKLARIRDFPMYGWTDTQFRRMAMLSGCDYLDSIPGMGLKTAYRLLRRHKTVERLFQQIRLEGTMQIPQHYQKDFAQAELAFLHQRVFDPIEKRLVPLFDFPEGGLEKEDEKWVGLDKPIKIARGIALGDLHPETELPIVDMYKDHKGFKAAFVPIKNVKSVLGDSSNANVRAGPMDAFISRSKKPMRILPAPVGTFGSGVKSLSDLSSGLTTRKRPLPKEVDDSWDEPPPKNGKPKTSKFFSSEGGGDDKENIPEVQAGPSRSSRSPSLGLEDHVPSPSPMLSSLQNSPVHRSNPAEEEEDEYFETQPQSLTSAKVTTISKVDYGHDLGFADESMPHLSSPVGDRLSSPAFTTPPKSEPKTRRASSFTFSPSPTRCSIAADLDLDLIRRVTADRLGVEVSGAEGVLVDESSDFDLDSFSIPPTQLGGSSNSTPIKRERRFQSLSRLGTVLIPPSSPLGLQMSSSPRYHSIDPRQPHTNVAACKRKFQDRDTTSSDSFDSFDSFEQEELVTPSLPERMGVEDIVGDDDEDDVVDDYEEIERERERRAKVVGLSLREKFGYQSGSQSSSSPASQSFVPKRVMTKISTPRFTPSTAARATPKPRVFTTPTTGILSSRDINLQQRGQQQSQSLTRLRKQSYPLSEPRNVKPRISVGAEKSVLMQEGEEGPSRSMKTLERFKFTGKVTRVVV